MPIGYLFVALGLLCGTLIAAQGAINGRLSEAVEGPIQAALISFTVGWLALLALNISLGHRLPSQGQVASLPWWAWVGGLIGAVMVTSAATAVPRIGVAAWVSAVIAGQLSLILYTVSDYRKHMVCGHARQFNPFGFNVSRSTETNVRTKLIFQ